MAMFIGRNRKARTTYGFDEIALVPGNVTINPNEVDITFSVARKDKEPLKLAIPIIASAMDGVVDVSFAIEMGKLGGLAVLNLEGVQTRYKNPEEVLLKVLEADKEQVTGLLQKIYQEPVQEDLIGARIKKIKDAGVIAAVSSIPQKAERYGRIAQEAGVDLFVVQSTVSTVRHISTQYKSLDLKAFCGEMRSPVVVGNTVGYDVTLEIIECGVAGVLVGVGPGAACTSRGVLGLGVPQVTRRYHSADGAVRYLLSAQGPSAAEGSVGAAPASYTRTSGFDPFPAAAKFARKSSLPLVPGLPGFVPSSVKVSSSPAAPVVPLTTMLLLPV